MKYKRDKENRLLITTEQAIELYLEWFNNFITVQAFASYLCTSEEDALNIINRGKINHEQKVK